MPLIFFCSRRHLLSVDPSVSGKRVRCPVCNEVMIAPPVPPKAEEPAAGGLVPPPAPVAVESPVIPHMELPASSPPPFVLPVPAQDPPVASLPLATIAPPLESANSPDANLNTALSTLPLDSPAEPSPDDLSSARHRQKKQRPTDEDDDEDDPESFTPLRPKLSRRRQMERLKLGLALHYWKYLAVLVGNLLLQASLLLTTVPFLVLVGVITLILGFLVNIAAPLLGLTGSLLCSTAPEKVGGRPLILTSLGFDAVAVLLTMIGAVLAVMIRSVMEANLFTAFLYLALLANFAGFILFMLFLQRVSLYFKDESSAHEILTIIVTLVLVVLGGPLAIVFLAALFAALFGPESALVIAGMGLLIMLVVYLQLLFRILTVISTLRARI
jgi:hypothetical protein